MKEFLKTVGQILKPTKKSLELGLIFGALGVITVIGAALFSIDGLAYVASKAVLYSIAIPSLVALGSILERASVVFDDIEQKENHTVANKTIGKEVLLEESEVYNTQQTKTITKNNTKSNIEDLDDTFER